MYQGEEAYLFLLQFELGELVVGYSHANQIELPTAHMLKRSYVGTLE